MGLGTRLVVKSLWAQKKYLEVRDGVLYRRWEDAGGGGVNKCLQLVIPPSQGRRNERKSGPANA